MTYNVRNPLNKAFKRPDFSVEEFRKRIQQRNINKKKVKIRKAPPIPRRPKLTSPDEESKVQK